MNYLRGGDNMCDICNIEVHESKHIRQGEWNDLYIERDSYFYYIVAKADGNAYYMIKYCPNCGRKLGEE